MGGLLRFQRKCSCSLKLQLMLPQKKRYAHVVVAFKSFLKEAVRCLYWCLNSGTSTQGVGAGRWLQRQRADRYLSGLRNPNPGKLDVYDVIGGAGIAPPSRWSARQREHE